MSSPIKSFRFRMGGVIRHTSSVLAISNTEGRKSTTSPAPSGTTPTVQAEPVPRLPPVVELTPPPTPQPTQNGTRKTVKRPLPIAAQYQMYPSPIAESPAREVEKERQNAAAELQALHSRIPSPELSSTIL
ncbi:hypothetical protein B0H12DRAFT_1235658 [Mycena haematopus]|nr:hypothetical protein B0H12DRAFT_1235658 [Mycena haematopus]